MYRRESSLSDLLSAAMPDANDLEAPRAVVLVRDDDDDGGTKALADPVIAVDSRRSRAALVVFIAAVSLV